MAYYASLLRLTIATPHYYRCEADYCRCVRADQLPGAQLQEAIAVAKVRAVGSVILTMAILTMAILTIAILIKVRAVETVIQLCFRLKQARPPHAYAHAHAHAHAHACTCTCTCTCYRLEQAVGSYALMVGSGFEHLDGMQIAKFAEGESFVLMQKLVR